MITIMVTIMIMLSSPKDTTVVGIVTEVNDAQAKKAQVPRIVMIIKMMVWIIVVVRTY